jgi:hypothetical protein
VEIALRFKPELGQAGRGREPNRFSQERLPPRPLRRRSRRVRGESPLRNPKFISASMFVGAAFAATFAGSGRQGSNGRSGFSRDPLCHRKLEVRSCRGGFHSDHLILEDGGSGLKPLLQKSSFGRSGFSRDLCVIEDGDSGLQGRPSPGPFAASKTGSGLKPLLQKSSFGRSGFSRDHCVIESQGFGVVGVVSVVTLASSKAEGSGRKILLQKPSFVGTASAATLAPLKTEGSGRKPFSTVIPSGAEASPVLGGAFQSFRSWGRKQSPA